MTFKDFVVTIAVCVSLPSLVAGQVGLPEKTYPVFTHYAEPPATLSGLASESDAVIVATVERSRSRQQYAPGAASTSVMTDYTLSITDILKAHPQLPPVGADVQVQRYGGDVVEADHIRKSVEANFPPFKSGQTYLLFLVRNRMDYRFEILYGPGGAYRVSNGKVHALGRSRLAMTVEGKPANTVLADLRDALIRQNQ